MHNHSPSRANSASRELSDQEAEELLDRLFGDAPLPTPEPDSLEMLAAREQALLREMTDLDEFLNPEPQTAAPAQPRALAPAVPSVTLAQNEHSNVPPISRPRACEQKPWSKRVTRRRRRSASKDCKALELTRISAPTKDSGAEGTLEAKTTPPKTSITTEKNARRRYHCWEHTSDPGKVTTATRVLEANGSGYLFALDLSPDEIKAAHDHANGFTDYFYRSISRALKRELGCVPDLLITPGATPWDRLHINGVIEIAESSDLDATKRALEDAGGVWAHQHGQQYQCDIKLLRNDPALHKTPDIWANYILRDAARARQLINGRSVSATRRLRQRAKQFWNGANVAMLATAFLILEVAGRPVLSARPFARKATGDVVAERILGSE
jgi:hypothetical protein